VEIASKGQVETHCSHTTQREKFENLRVELCKHYSRSLERKTKIHELIPLLI